jgi:hypothetical protein
LGGHSLLAVKLKVRVSELFEIDYSIEDIFQSGQLKQSAVVIDKYKAPDSEDILQAMGLVDDLCDEEVSRMLEALSKEVSEQ